MAWNFLNAFGRRKLPRGLGQWLVSRSSVSSSTPTFPATSPETLAAPIHWIQGDWEPCRFQTTLTRPTSEATWLLSGPTLSVTPSRLPDHPLCPEASCVCPSLLPPSLFPDDIYTESRRATSMPRDDIIFKFPPVKTRREKWEILGENHVARQLR